jgi:hypothetical protein
VRVPTLAFLAGVVLTGCGLNVQSPDLFVLTRTGQGASVTVLVNDGGTIRCNGVKRKPLSDPLLIQARSIASDLDKDAKASLKIPPKANSVYRYRITLQDGTISFPDTAAATHGELARAEQFVLEALTGPCRGT